MATVQEILNYSTSEIIDKILDEFSNKYKKKKLDKLSLGQLRYILLNELSSVDLNYYQFDWNEEKSPMHMYLYDESILTSILEDCLDEDDLLFRYAVLEEKEKPKFFYGKRLFKMVVCDDNFNLKAFKKIIEKGADIDYRDNEDDDYTLLALALEGSNEHKLIIVKTLLENGATVNYDDEKPMRVFIEGYWTYSDSDFKDNERFENEFKPFDRVLFELCIKTEISTFFLNSLFFRKMTTSGYKNETFFDHKNR